MVDKQYPVKPGPVTVAHHVGQSVLDAFLTGACEVQDDITGRIFKSANASILCMKYVMANYHG